MYIGQHHTRCVMYDPSMLILVQSYKYMYCASTFQAKSLQFCYFISITLLQAFTYALHISAVYPLWPFMTDLYVEEIVIDRYCFTSLCAIFPFISYWLVHERRGSDFGRCMFLGVHLPVLLQTVQTKASLHLPPANEPRCRRAGGVQALWQERLQVTWATLPAPEELPTVSKRPRRRLSLRRWGKHNWDCVTV